MHYMGILIPIFMSETVSVVLDIKLSFSFSYFLDTKKLFICKKKGKKVKKAELKEGKKRFKN